MNAYETAKQTYEALESPVPFSRIVECHLANGYLFCTPEIFICGRPVLKGASEQEITSPWITFDNPNCWFIYLVSRCRYYANTMHPIEYFYRHEPYELPWVAWERKGNGIEYYDYNRVKRRVLGKDGTRSIL